MTAAARTVVFDIGNVLVRWDVHLAWLDDLGSREAVDAFLARVDFAARNLRADGGETFADLAAEIADPDDRARLAAYPGRHHLTIAEPIAGTWDILRGLKARGIATHAITNWSAETWPEGLRLHPELAALLDVIVVSGQERVLKPAPAIFATLCDRAGVAPGDCVFVDDSPRNVAGARAAGMDAIHFTTPEALHAALSDRGLA
jgi:HAD superfamily hydrolase (TIGR01509 family)